MSKTHGGFENGVIEYKNVYHKYKDDFVLSGASFKINQGEKIALVGHIGSGKSTAIKLLLGFLPLTMGDITIRGCLHSPYFQPRIAKTYFLYPPKTEIIQSHVIRKHNLRNRRRRSRKDYRLVARLEIRRRCRDVCRENGSNVRTRRQPFVWWSKTNRMVVAVFFRKK